MIYGVTGAVVVVSILLTSAIIIGYYYKVSKKVNTHFDPDLHIYDLPDAHNLGPSLPPRLIKVDTVNEKEISDNSLKENGSKLEKTCEEDCKHAQPTHHLELQFSDCLECNALSSIKMQSNNVYGIRIQTEDLPSTVSFLSNYFPMHFSEQGCIYEQIPGYERIEPCDKINTVTGKESPIGENVANTSTAMSKQISDSHEGNQQQCHFTTCACDMVCRGHNFENTPTVCRKQCQELPIEMQSNSGYAMDYIPLRHRGYTINSANPI